jgi:hypothetical protein
MSVQSQSETSPRVFPSLLVSPIPHWRTFCTFRFYETLLSNAGGGGERVLWTAVAALQRTEPDIISVVYSGDIDASKDEIIAKVKVRGIFFLSNRRS